MSQIQVFKKSFIASLLLFALFAQPTLAMSFSTNYKNCAQLKVKYRFGVALSLKTAGDYPAKISKSIYGTNSFLDSDSDGIACENEILQNNLNPNARSTTTTSSPAVSVTSVAPVATSPQYVEWRNGGSVTLRSGVSYQIYACTDGQNGTTYLDVFSIKTGWTQKATGRSALDAARCPNPSRLYPWTFGWIVTEIPGEVSKMMLRGIRLVSEMTVVISN
jgi:hypothetical protein